MSKKKSLIERVQPRSAPVQRKPVGVVTQFHLMRRRRYQELYSECRRQAERYVPEFEPDLRGRELADTIEWEARINALGQISLWRPNFRDYLRDELLVVWGDGFLAGSGDHPGEPLGLDQTLNNVMSVLVRVIANEMTVRHLEDITPLRDDLWPNPKARRADIKQNLKWVLEEAGIEVVS